MTETMTVSQEIRRELFERQDKAYRAFQAKLMPGVSPERIIGVRTPVLRRMARIYAGRPDIGDFFADLPHAYYDENNLHGFILSRGKDYGQTVERVDALLPYVDNWATCDLLSPTVFRKNRDRLHADVSRWLSSRETYTLRFGIEMVMSHYLDEDFEPSYLERIAAIRHDEYYVNMMIAWFFATALAKQWEAAIPYIEQGRLSDWVHQKTIQKATESLRLTEEQKDYVKSWRRK